MPGARVEVRVSFFLIAGSILSLGFPNEVYGDECRVICRHVNDSTLGLQQTADSNQVDRFTRNEI